MLMAGQQVLIAVQSLLTSPNTEVSMRPAAARLYREDRAEYERVAEQWTRRYAMFHYR